MRETLRRILSWLGLTGKLVFHVAWILTLSLGVMIGATWLRARTVIHDELRKTEMVRVERWAIANRVAIESADRWKIADALVDLGHGPYVVYAGFFDRAGQPIAHQGEEDAYLLPHRLDLLIPIRAAGGAGPAIVEIPPPLPGMVSDPRDAARAVPLEDRIRRALEGVAGDGDHPRGFIDVTLATEPLDSLLSALLARLLVLAAVLLGGGLLATWALVRQMVLPLRILKEHAAWISDGRLDEAFHLVPRPPDEIGELATGFSVMASVLKARREELEAQIVERTRSLQMARMWAAPSELDGIGSGRLARAAHDLKTPVTSIRAFAEILLDDEAVGADDRRRYLETMLRESDRLARMIDELGRERAPLAAVEAEATPGGDAEWDEALAAAAAAEAADIALPGPREVATLRRVLVASADDSLRALLKLAFSNDGTEVVEAGDAVSALRLTRETLPDGVVLDLLMEGGEALTMLTDLREDRRTERIPILPLSVVRDGERMRAGAISFQPKPLDRERFLAAVRSALPADLGRGARVLIVDDDRFIAEAIGTLLSREGMETQIASGGEEALLAARGDRPDLIVLDLKMPGLDGVEVIRRLRARPETMERPVILMTAHDIPREDQAAWPGVSLTRELFLKGVRAALLEVSLR